MASLIKRNNGYYYVIYREGGRQRWMSTHARDEKDAMAYFESIKASLPCNCQIRLEDLRQQILKYANLNFKDGTVALYKAAFKKLIACWGNRPLRFVSALDVETFKEFLIKHVTKVTANDYLRTLKTAFNIAIRLNFAESNPFKGCKMFRIPRVLPAYLQKEEFIRLLHTIPDEHFGRLVFFAALTGMRRGEIVSLRWENVDYRETVARLQSDLAGIQA